MKEIEVPKETQIDRTKHCLARVCRFLNFIASLVLISCFIFRCLVWSEKTEKNQPTTKPKDPFYYFLALYLVPFAIVITLAELNYRPVIKYVNFLKH